MWTEFTRVGQGPKIYDAYTSTKGLYEESLETVVGLWGLNLYVDWCTVEVKLHLIPRVWNVSVLS